jgi:hypothetical protein
MSARRCLLVPLLVLAALLPFAGVSAAHDSSLEVVADGLDNPRGLDFSHWGALYVAEAGRGGAGPCIPGPDGDVCAGASGAVTKIWHGKQRRVVKGLPSLATPGRAATPESAAVAAGSDAIGPSDISFGFFSAYLTVGLGQNPAVRVPPTLGPLGPKFGKLYRISPFGRVRAVADISAYEQDANPDGNMEEGGVDSNPNSVLARPGRQYVVDAGGNDLLRVGPTGRISTVAVFPPGPVPPGPPFQAVPTAVVRGPDRALYVSQLTGFPFPVERANIYRIEPGSEPEVYAEDLTNVTDLAFGPDGSLYVVEIATNGLLSGDPTGALKRIAPDGSVSEDLANGELEAPYGVTVSRKGHVYVTNHGTSAGGGEVVRVDTD